MYGEITGDRLKKLAARALTNKPLRRRSSGRKPRWMDDKFYIVSTNGQSFKSVPARRLSFDSKFHRYFDNYFYAWACFQRIQDKHHEEPDCA